MWGNQPWDNDQAADWFGFLMENTDLPQIVRETLLIHIEEGSSSGTAPSMRAAIFCLVQFCRVYVWPIDELDKDLALGINVLEDVIKSDIYANNEDILQSLKSDLGTLKSRLTN